MANIINFPYESSTTFLSLNVAGCYKVLVGTNPDQIDLYYNVPSGTSTATYAVTLDWNGTDIEQSDITALGELVQSLKKTPAASAEFKLVSDDTAKLLPATPFAVSSKTQP